MKPLLLHLLLLLPASSAFSAENPQVRVTPVAENILRVQIAPEGSPANPNKVSALVTPPKTFAGKCRITAKVDGGTIRFTDQAGKLLLTQTTSSFGESKVDEAGFRSVMVGWESGAPDGLYGLGCFQDGHLDIRGHELACHQKNLEDIVPMLVSTGGFGILWDNAAPFTFKAQAQASGFTLDSRTGGEVDYYLIADPSPNAVIAGYRQLTGAAPMFPKWVFGYHQSKERYRSQQEILDIAKQFRDLKFPIDLIIQDWQYWGEYGWNACKFDTERFPDAKGMIEQLHADNLHYITSVWPNFNNAGKKGSDVYKELAPLNVISAKAKVMNAYYYDAFNDTARGIVWKHAKKGLFDIGVDGWWLDGSEPEAGGNGPGGGHQTVEDVFTFAPTCAAGPFPAVANAYPFYAVKAFHDGQRADDAGKRFFTLTRSVYAGSQRLGACYWTGDTRSTWESFRNQIPACLNMSAAGIPYVNTDIGGFAAGPEPELAVRWLQFGAFCGEMRMHGTGMPREPWRFGKAGDATYDTMLAFTNLRYQLLPYIYSTAWQVTNSHASLMRALPLDFPNDPAVRNVADEFMFGPSLLVAPVTTPHSGSAQTIPATALFDNNKQPGGLDGTYFKGKGMNTEVLKRKDAEIRFNWSKTPREGMGADPALDPIPALGNMEQFSVRWTGFLKTEEAGLYTIDVTSDDGFLLKLNGKNLSSDMSPHEERTTRVTVNLPANTMVPVQLDYYQGIKAAKVELRWTKPSATLAEYAVRPVTLPAGTDWYDFWTGKKQTGGQTFEAKVPMTSMPLLVRAGSILPFGPALQHTADQPNAPLELRVYPGADASFTLYDDASDGYGYEKGERATLPLTWDDKAKTLTLGKRDGTFPGMAASRQFTVRVLQADGSWKDKPVTYDGKKQQVKL